MTYVSGASAFYRRAAELKILPDGNRRLADE